MRVESGRIPDVETFGKLCAWLEVDPGRFLGNSKKVNSAEAKTETLSISAHFKVEKEPRPETVTALAKMILLAMRTQPSNKEIDADDENA